MNDDCVQKSPKNVSHLKKKGGYLEIPKKMAQKDNPQSKNSWLLHTIPSNSYLHFVEIITTETLFFEKGQETIRKIKLRGQRALQKSSCTKNLQY